MLSVLGLALAALAAVAAAALMVRAAGWPFVLRRFGQAVLIIVVVSFATTVMLDSTDGDPCLASLGTGATEEAWASCRVDRKLDENVFVQYADWSSGVLTGDLGYAKYKTQVPLTDVLADRAPRTLLLFAYSQTVALAIAVPLGIWAAYQAGRPPRPVPRRLLPAAVLTIAVVGVVVGWSVVAVLTLAGAVPLAIYHGVRGGPGSDRLVNSTAFVFLAIPVFVLGETLRYWFAIRWGWYDLTGYASPSDGLGAHIRSIWLPAIVLGLAIAPVYLRLLRADMLQNLQQDYVAVAKAKGMTNTHVLLRHVLRPSSLTLLTVAGLNIAQLVNGSIVVEFIYDIDGMGGYLIEAVAAREFFPVQTIVALVAVLFVVANTIIDVLYTAVDPRVKADSQR